MSSIQDEIIDKYGKEADGIDVVNGKLSENIKKMRELEVKENKKWLRDNRKGIEEAKDYLKDNNDPILKFDVDVGDFTRPGSGGLPVWTGRGSDGYEEAKQEGSAYFEFLKRELEKSGMSDYIKFIEKSSGGTSPVGVAVKYRYAFEFADDLTNDQKKEVYLALQEAYNKMLDSGIAFNDYFDIKGKKLDRLNERVLKTAQSVETINKELAITNENDAWEKLNNESNEQAANFYNLIDKAAALSQEINNPENTPAVTYNKQLELEDLRDEIIALTAEFPVLSEEAERAFNNMGLNIDGTIASTDNLRESFFETLDEIQKGTLTNVDTIEKAMKTLAEGGELEHMEVWNIWQLDEDKITQPYYDEDAKKLKMDYEDLVLLKDRLIEKEQERLQIEIETTKQARKNVQKELADVDAKIKKEAKGNTKPRGEWIVKQAELRKQIEEWGDEIQRNELLIKDLNSSLGDTIAAEEKIKKLQKDINKIQEQADNYEKAFTQKVDNVIDSLESEKEILNEELDSLNDQLDVLEKQKDELDKIIDNYKQVADIVSDAVDKEKELLEVTYSFERGWHYDVDNDVTFIISHNSLMLSFSNINSNVIHIQHQPFKKIYRQSS